MPPAPDFARLFGRAPATIATAPGRVNLIGEHTDYNGGFVLPVAIPQRTQVELAPRDDMRARVFSAGIAGAGAMEEYELGNETPRHSWADYVQGVTQVLQRDGHRLRGFDARVSSTVPIGGGLSSSAALEVAMLRALREAFDLRIDDVRVAVLGRKAENEFVGAPVGVMDQMAASLADDRTALFIDTRTLGYDRVPLPAESELVVVNSGVSHGHAGGEYRVRRRECEEASRALGVRELRDIGLEDLARVESLPPPLDRRVRHVLTENARVLEAVDAMRAADLARLGKLFYASHASMRDDYEVSVVETDYLVESACEDPGVFGARLTGGGFGGSIVALAREGRGREVGRRLVERYGTRFGHPATLLVPTM